MKCKREHCPKDVSEWDQNRGMVYCCRECAPCGYLAGGSNPAPKPGNSFPRSAPKREHNGLVTAHKIADATGFAYVTILELARKKKITSKTEGQFILFDERQAIAEVKALGIKPRSKNGFQAAELPSIEETHESSIGDLALIGSGELAIKAGVARQTILTWTIQGKIPVAKRTLKGQARYDEAQALAAIATFKGEGRPSTKIEQVPDVKIPVDVTACGSGLSILTTLLTLAEYAADILRKEIKKETAQ